MYKLSLPILLLALLGACGIKKAPLRASIDLKSEPYDFFSQQRAYPFDDFDWKAWRKALHEAQSSARAEERNLDCGGNSSAWTQQGPMNVGGRCNTLAVKPDDELTVLAGFSMGGIFKSTDGGVNWYPVFDDNPELAIGCITYDPNQPNVVYAGTGDPNMPGIVFNGDGIYKSTDGGEHWQKLPNAPGNIISKIIVHPGNSAVLWASSMGNPYLRDNERGVYKSSDGGASWQKVLFVSDQAGACALVEAPTDPQILYAAFWDRIRSNKESIVYGPHALIYKSSDAGETWTQMSSGLPSGIWGRIGLAISNINANKVYAVYIDTLSTTGGLYKTTNGGQTWNAMNVTQLENACSDFGWYFGKLHLNPGNDEEVYFHGILLWKKPSGSNTWATDGNGHADSHDLVFTPSGRRYWANDGGVYYRAAGQSSWTKSKNLPVTQFYHTTYNQHDPQNFWAGAQDNGIQKGNGLSPNLWQQVVPADGFHCAFDPLNADHFWVETQNGVIHETMDGGNNWVFGNPALGTSDRTNWDTPFFMSVHSTSNTLYAATYRVYFKSNGSGWGPISGDLTDGNIYGARFHTISCLNESPIIPEKLVAGTTDGNVWRREPTGSWVNISAGLPDRYLTSVHYSPTLNNRIFVTQSGFRDNDDTPHIYRSDNNGASWTSISANMPPLPVNDLYVMPGQNDQVLFAATDAGVYFSTNGGGEWGRLGSNMPNIPVFDLEPNPVRDELAAATFGRGVWTFPFDSVFTQQNQVLVNLSGAIQSESGEGIANVQVTPDISDAAGLFSLDNLPGCSSYTLTPQRNDNPLNGLTTYDLVLISKHILATEPLSSPYKMIAADANRSGSITTFDIVQFRKLILGVDTVFSGNTSWRFVPANFAFPNQQNPFQTVFPESLEATPGSTSIDGLNFRGIKVGDVNNTAAPNGMLEENRERSYGEWPFYIKAQPLRSGARVEVVVYTTNPNAGLKAMQFSLRFDSGKLLFKSLLPAGKGIEMDQFGLQNAQQGLIRFAYHEMTPQTAVGRGAQVPLFKIVFEAKQSAEWPDVLSFVNGPVPGLVYDAQGRAHEPVWDWSHPALAAIDNTVCWPNPFGSSGVWVSGKAGEIFEIFDVNGKRLRLTTMPEEGILFIESGVFPKAGMYFWRAGEESGKLVFVPG